MERFTFWEFSQLALRGPPQNVTLLTVFSALIHHMMYFSKGLDINFMQKNTNKGRDSSSVTLMFEKHGNVASVFFSF